MQMTWSTCRARSVKYALLCHKGLGFFVVFFILPISVDKDNSWCAGIFLRDSCSFEDVLHVIVTHDHHHTDCLVSSSDVESLTVVNIFSQIFLGFFQPLCKSHPHDRVSHWSHDWVSSSRLRLSWPLPDFHPDAWDGFRNRSRQSSRVVTKTPSWTGRALN